MEMQALSIATGDDAGDNVCDDDLDRDVLTAWKFVDSLVAKELEKKGAKLRGPFMARMELVNRSRQHGVGQHLADVATPLQMFCEYYDLFGDRYCCYSDVDNYLHLMDDSQQSEVWQPVCLFACLVTHLNWVTQNGKQCHKHLL